MSNALGAKIVPARFSSGCRAALNTDRWRRLLLSAVVYTQTFLLTQKNLGAVIIVERLLKIKAPGKQSRVKGPGVVLRG